MRIECRVFPPFIAKTVEGIFGYDLLLYGFLFRRQWGSSSRSFARIGLLFIKRRRVERKAVRARTFLVRLAHSIPCAVVYKLRFTLDKQEKNIFIFRTHFDIFIIQAYTTIWSIIKKKIENKSFNRFLFFAILRSRSLVRDETQCFVWM